MTENDYWNELRARINSLGGAPLSRLGWCDWFEPRRFVLDGPAPHVTGRVGFVRGGHVETWHFILVIGSTAGGPADVDWAALLPADDASGWLAFDIDQQQLVIDPLSRR